MQTHQNISLSRGSFNLPEILRRSQRLRRAGDIIIVILLLFSPQLSYTQTICFNVDSVEVYSIPWKYHSKIGLSTGEIIGMNFQKNVFTDTAIINDLLIAIKENILIIENSTYVDPRMEIVLYLEGIPAIISIEISGLYLYRGHVYNLNYELIEWINKNVKEFSIMEMYKRK